ncbi:hypothetical protein PV325_005443 [Microctonus aethiopoides]|nr:hypothetical protein PV325_005443 [Microctonus aethiopoides]KAK0083731.1 hypothetical protein PV326_006603 [Microctonus aethiopoides]
MMSIEYCRSRNITPGTLLKPIVWNNSSNEVASVPLPLQKKEQQENIARITKRYLDDNMQQTWINPRLISMVSYK